MYLIEKENILVVKDQDQVTLYAVQELIKKFQMSPQYNRVNHHYNKLSSLQGSLVGQLPQNSSIGETGAAFIASNLKLPAQLKMISRVKTSGTGADGDVFAAEDAENENNYSESDVAS